MDTNLPELKYCFLKRKLECYGEFRNRKARWEDLPSSGCGTLFLIPIREKVWDEEKHRIEVW
jgi:hypothetical protein